MCCIASSSSSGTKWMAVLFLLFAKWRSTQLWLALILPPTYHFQNGALLVSRVFSQGLYQSRRSAYSLKHSGKLSRLNRSYTFGSVRFAWAVNLGGG